MVLTQWAKSNFRGLLPNPIQRVLSEKDEDTLCVF